MHSPELAARQPHPYKLFRADLYLSFLYSQGRSDLQSSLFEGLAVTYRDSLPRAAFLTVCNIDMQLDRKRPIGLPRGHQQIGENIVERHETYINEWQNFQTILQRYCRLTPDNAPVYDARIGEKVLGEMIKTDIKYQRAERTMDDDPHASYVRDFVLGDRPCQSIGITAVFRMAQSAFIKSESSPDLHELAVAWTINHPGQTF